MKTFIHTMYYLPEFGSAPILMNELASFLSSKGYDIEVVTTIPRPPHHKDFRGLIYQKESDNGFSIKRFRTNFTVHHIGRLIAWSIYTGFSILNLLTVKKGDVLFLRLPPLQLGVTGFFAKKLRGAKVLLSVQDIHPDLSIESGLLKKPWAIKLAKSFEKWIYRNSDEIIVISEGFRQNLEEKDVNPAKIKVIPNWVDTDVLQPHPKDNRLSQKLSLNKKFVVMYSGTISLSSYLSLEKVLEAASVLKNEVGLSFFIVGEGLKKPDLVQKAKTLELDNVIFLPFQPYEDLPNLLAASDILLVPLDKEKTQLSVPSKLYNYIAAGRPILGLTDSTSEVARIINEAKCGLSAEPDDINMIVKHILDMKNSPEDCERFGQNARQYCLEFYSKDKVLQMYESSIVSL
ncbi:MAG: glycosyltransferase family 4 protein [Candidatus Aminicenantes bacterium]|nr:glycosyltransferase family 4 protein [Candidatus Aminicenantes bacterium]